MTLLFQLFTSQGRAPQGALSHHTLSRHVFACVCNLCGMSWAVHWLCRKLVHRGLYYRITPWLFLAGGGQRWLVESFSRRCILSPLTRRIPLWEKSPFLENSVNKAGTECRSGFLAPTFFALGVLRIYLTWIMCSEMREDSGVAQHHHHHHSNCPNCWDH